MLTSSTGFSLLRNQDIANLVGIDPKFICKAGARFADFWPWLLENLEVKVELFGKITLYIWLGTCDLTVKSAKCITLRHHSNEYANEYLVGFINKYVQFVGQFPSVNLVFVEIPPYSITVWNRSKGHGDPDSFQDQDRVLRERIVNLIDYIHHINSVLAVRSPCLRVDLIRYRKRKGQDYRISVDFGLYKDEIHASHILARCWMKKFVLSFIQQCV